MKRWTPKQLTPAFPRPGNKAGSPHTDLLPRAASPSAPSGLNCLLGAAASSPRSLLYPRRHEVTAAAKQAARQGARNLSGPRAPPLNPSANRRIQGSHVTGGGWPPRGQDGMGVGDTEAGAGLLAGPKGEQRPRESAQRGKGTLERTTSPSRQRGHGSQTRISIEANAAFRNGGAAVLCVQPPGICSLLGEMYRYLCYPTGKVQKYFSAWEGAGSGTHCCAFVLVALFRN